MSPRRLFLLAIPWAGMLPMEQSRPALLGGFMLGLFARGCHEVVKRLRPPVSFWTRISGAVRTPFIPYRPASRAAFAAGDPERFWLERYRAAIAHV
jgi:hypothetical protein